MLSQMVKYPFSWLLIPFFFCVCTYTYNIFSTYSSTLGQSDSFHVFTIANNTLLLFLTGLKCHLLEPWGAIKAKSFRDFPGSPVVQTLHFHCVGPRFDPWLGK